jgi:hypothetical protein
MSADKSNDTVIAALRELRERAGELGEVLDPSDLLCSNEWHAALDRADAMLAVAPEQPPAAQDKADAARIDWLEANWGEQPILDLWLGVGLPGFPATLRQAIDAKMKEQQRG